MCRKLPQISFFLFPILVLSQLSLLLTSARQTEMCSSSYSLSFFINVYPNLVKLMYTDYNPAVKVVHYKVCLFYLRLLIYRQ